MDLILLFIFGGALYRTALGYNIRPWRWVGNFVGAFLATILVLSFILFGIYGRDLIDNKEVMMNVQKTIPVTMLYQFLLFMYFRSMMKKYVLFLDKADEMNDEVEPTQSKPDTRDFSHFR